MKVNKIIETFLSYTFLCLLVFSMLAGIAYYVIGFPFADYICYSAYIVALIVVLCKEYFYDER